MKLIRIELKIMRLLNSKSIKFQSKKMIEIYKTNLMKIFPYKNKMKLFPNKNQRKQRFQKKKKFKKRIKYKIKK
jgi:hypothetical protein